MFAFDCLSAVLSCAFSLTQWKIQRLFTLGQIFLIAVLVQVRRATRLYHNIPGSCCEDCCTSYFCMACTVTQVVGQLWARPAEVPGCTCGDQAAHLP
jgi:hypothetical protein